MSQFTLTPEEDLLVLGAVRARAAQYLSSMGVNDSALDALTDKIQSQFTPAVVEAAPEVEEPPEVAEAEAAAEAAFLDDVPHEQHTEE
jgi:hypothetical protein